MRTTDAFVGLTCLDCGEQFDPETTSHRCPDCEGILDPRYDLEAVDLTPDEIADRGTGSMYRYGELLPFSRETAVSLGEGTTPLVECPALADKMGVDRVLIKDEGQNPTGTFKDRGQSLAVTAAREHGADAIALNSAGNAGQAAAAYAARAGMDAHVFLPERAGFTQKAMVEIHGGDLHVADPIDGDAEIGDAGAAYARAMADADWYSTKTFVTPYRHEGKKTMALEILEELDWQAPDAVVYPTGGGVGLVGMHKAARELRELGWIDELPPLYAAQATGCAPIVDAFEDGREEHQPVAEVETVCNGIAIPDPGASRQILSAIRESEGGAVATDDAAILEAAIEVAQSEGVEVGATCAAAASGAFELATRDEFDADDTVVLLNTGAGNKDVATLRSQLGDRSS